MENDSEISSSSQIVSTFNFDGDKPELENGFQQVSSLKELLVTCANSKTNIASSAPMVTKLLPSKRTRKATRKKLESLQSSSNLYECSECAKTFTRLSQFRSHTKSHVSGKEEVLFKCDSCDEVSDSLRTLIVHRRKHEGEFSCLLCHLEFNNQNSLKHHMKTHKGLKPYICKECGASFSQSGHLSIHTRTHTGEKPYTCEICNNNFKQISHLKTHVRTHTHDKPYSCNQCPAAFTQNSSLKRHRRAHTGEKPYKCVHCEMTFVVKSNMQRHLNTHTGERPFQCDLCPASFGQAIDLKRHKISHTGIKPYKCDMCEAAFSRKNNLKWHKLTHSENAGYHCIVCFAGFSTTGDLKAHMRNHAPPKPYVCDICPASFRATESLAKHKMIHAGGRPLRVKSNCKQEASIKQEKVKPFTCIYCDASFCEKRNLKRHSLSMHNNIESMNNFEISVDCDNIAEVTVGMNSSSPENSVDQNSVCLQDTKAIISGDEHTCLQNDIVTIPSSQQIVMQTISSHDGISHVPQFLLAGPGQAPRPARPAGQCQNHSLHVLTLIDGSYNHWQSWCFCDVPNIPDSAAQIMTSNTSSNEIVSESLTQILVTSPIQSFPESTTQLIMAASPTSPITTPHVLINSVCSSDPTIVHSDTSVAPLSMNDQSLEIQGNVITGTDVPVQFLRHIKQEEQQYVQS